MTPMQKKREDRRINHGLDYNVANFLDDPGTRSSLAIWNQKSIKQEVIEVGKWWKKSYSERKAFQSSNLEKG